jgi:hypothetical protein
MLKIRTENISGLIFWALFPGFFFYNYLVANEYFAPFLGGYFGIVALLSAPVVAFIYLRRVYVGNLAPNKVDGLFFLLTTYVATVSAIGYLNGVQKNVDADLIQDAFSGILFNTTLFLLVRSLNYESESLKRAIFISLLVMTVLVVSNVNDLGVYHVDVNSGSEEAISTYQGLGRSLAITAIFALATTTSKPMFFVTALASMIALFLNGARSELMGAMLAMLFIAAGKFKMRNMFLIAAGLPILLLTVGADAFENNRFFELFTPEASSSANARSELTANALATISANPIFGDYGSYAYDAGYGVGNYSHNLLSAWVDLGVVGFLFYIVLFFVAGRIALKAFKNESLNVNLMSLAVGYFSFTVLLMFFAKDYKYMTFGLTMGFLAKTLSDSQRLNNLKRRGSF